VAQDKLQSVEILRGLAALAVTWFHLTMGHYSQSWVGATGSYGWLGVEVFFVISGFVIPFSLYSSQYQTRSYGRFLLRRLVRLEPPYLASIVLVILLGFASSLAPGFQGDSPAYSVPQVLSHLLYLIPFTDYSWLNVVYWTLAYEFAFYLISGLTFVVLWRAHLAFTILFALAIFAMIGATTHHWDTKIFLFLMGISCCRMHVGRDPLSIFLACLAGTSALMIYLGDWQSALAGSATALAIPYARFPKWRPLLWLGAISYSLYLTHVPIGGRVVNLGKRFIEGEWSQLALSLVALAVSLLCAWVFFKVVESPAQRASKMVHVRQRAVAAAEG
jgi:peptidoglycan/LPS O-acetylase OafA/YrhL